VGDQIRQHLQTYYRHALPGRQEAEIGPPTNISAGWESELYAFDVAHGPATARRREELVLRIYYGDGAEHKARREFGHMRRLHQAGYPVPRVDILEHRNSPFGRPFVIMERIDGQMMWPLLDRASGAERQALLTQFCALLAQLHNLDWRLFLDDAAPFAPEDPYAFVDRWLSIGRDLLQRSPQVDLAPMAEWLEGRRDALACPRPSLVHGDFHPGNILVRRDGSAVVVDWTASEISDARSDLAWTLLLAYAYSGAEVHDTILHEYERLMGVTVEHIETFEVLACTRRLFDISVSLSEGAERQGMRPEAVAAIRRQMGAERRVYDLLLQRTGIRLPGVEKLFASSS
jgi:aminoglycoside phosphotransferase (APT) family kinase protein